MKTKRKKESRFRRDKSFASEDKNNLGQRRAFLIVKWVIYVFLAFLLFAFMVTPGFLEISGAVPLYLIPLIICIAMFEGEMAGAFYAIFAGLIWTSGTDVFWGFHSFLLFFTAIFSAVCVKYYFKITLLVNIIFVALGSIFYLAISYYVNYAMWNYEGTGRIISEVYLPVFIYTIAISPIIYFLIKFIYTFIWERTNDRKWTN